MNDLTTGALQYLFSHPHDFYKFIGEENASEIIDNQKTLLNYPHHQPNLSDYIGFPAFYPRTEKYPLSKYEHDNCCAQLNDEVFQAKQSIDYIRSKKFEYLSSSLFSKVDTQSMSPQSDSLGSQTSSQDSYVTHSTKLQLRSANPHEYDARFFTEVLNHRSNPEYYNFAVPSVIVQSIDHLFQRDGIIGEGTYGVVYRATKKSTGECVALKKFRWDPPIDSIPATSIREIVLLRELNHPNLIKLNGIYYEQKPKQEENAPRMFLEFEYIELDLRKYMKTFFQRRIPTETIRQIMYQTLKGIAYCHQRQIIHRDIKPNNILLRTLFSSTNLSQPKKRPATSHIEHPCQLRRRGIGGEAAENKAARITGNQQQHIELCRHPARVCDAQQQQIFIEYSHINKHMCGCKCASEFSHHHSGVICCPRYYLENQVLFPLESTIDNQQLDNIDAQATCASKIDNKISAYEQLEEKTNDGSISFQLKKIHMRTQRSELNVNVECLLEKNKDRCAANCQTNSHPIIPSDNRNKVGGTVGEDMNYLYNNQQTNKHKQIESKECYLDKLEADKNKVCHINSAPLYCQSAPCARHSTEWCSKESRIMSSSIKQPHALNKSIYDGLPCSTTDTCSCHISINNHLNCVGLHENDQQNFILYPYSQSKISSNENDLQSLFAQVLFRQTLLHNLCKDTQKSNVSLVFDQEKYKQALNHTKKEPENVCGNTVNIGCRCIVAPTKNYKKESSFPLPLSLTQRHMCVPEQDQKILVNNYKSGKYVQLNKCNSCKKTNRELFVQGPSENTEISTCVPNCSHLNTPECCTSSDTKQTEHSQCNSTKQQQHVQVKLADFGLARIVPYPLRPLTKEVVTLWYKAPEILLGCSEYTQAIDIWAVGCVLAELLYGRAIFSGEAEIDTLFKIFQLLGTPDETTWKGVTKLPYYRTVWPQWKRRSDRYDYFREDLDDDVKDLLDKLLAYDHRTRISAAEALEHPWFKDLRS